MTGVRVMRLLEYVYEDAEAAARDMANWTHSVGAHPSSKVRMKSAVLPFETIEWKEPE